jgi:aquaporin Z
MAVGRAGVLAPIAIGSVLMVMVFAGGHVSGGHYNPAVSTAVMLRGKMAQGEYMPTWWCRVLAGIAAALVIIILGYDFDTSAKLAGAARC